MMTMFWNTSLSFTLLASAILSVYTSISDPPLWLPASDAQTLLKPLTMSQTAKTASSQGVDAKDKGAPAPAATSKPTKTGEPGMGSYRVSHCSNNIHIGRNFFGAIYFGRRVSGKLVGLLKEPSLRQGESGKIGV
ncbi:hypothetical protein AMECASPLE_001430 [Ameca splendens]|uniref:Uncharacterized protein n=1 Tax=Ameca splendens TaxID=208324 RepID=A0ABV0ZUV1_9TELE